MHFYKNRFKMLKQNDVFLNIWQDRCLASSVFQSSLYWCVSVSGFRPPEVYCPASALPLGHPSFPRSQAVRHCAWVLWLSWVVLFTLCLLFPPFVMTLISFTCILFACLVYLNWYVSLIVCQFLVLPCVPSFRPLSFILFLYHCFLNLACLVFLFCFVLF